MRVLFVYLFDTFEINKCMQINDLCIYFMSIRSAGIYDICALFFLFHFCQNEINKFRFVGLKI